MFQVGCAQASSGVTAASSASARVRNGPPEPVSRIRRTPQASSPWAARGGRHWKIALCSLSIGSSSAPCARTAPMKIGPAMTRASLLARRSFLPASAAARVGASPAAPTIAAITTSTSGRVAADTSPASPASTSVATSAPARRRLSASAPCASASTAMRGRLVAQSSKRSSLCLFAVSANARNRSGCRPITSSVLRPIEPVAPSTATFAGLFIPCSPAPPPGAPQ